MRYEKLDKENKIMILTGERKEKGGAGKAKAKIESVFNRENEALKITVTTTVDISGKILQYGRGMFEQIAKQHFMQFSACAKNHLESQSTDKEKNST
jgi:carbon monoxide dehydrogenase subunit G